MVSVASGTATCVMAWKTAWTGATKRRAVIFSIHRTPGLIIRFRLWSTTVDRLVKSTLSKRLLKRINSNVGRNPVLISFLSEKLANLWWASYLGSHVTLPAVAPADIDWHLAPAHALRKSCCCSRCGSKGGCYRRDRQTNGRTPDRYSIYNCC